MIRTFQAFAGYDSQLMALDRLKVDYQCVGWSEIDKYAIQAHNAVYPGLADKNFGDIEKIHWAEVPDFDLFTYSFPCQDISNAGLQRGLSEGSGTRSSLLWECCKAIEAKRPKYLLMENVKSLTSKKFMPYLMKWEAYLRGLGYSNFTQVLNAKDYGIPQNRERVFMVSILSDDLFYRFPDPFMLDKRLGDVLEDDVDEKFYLSQKCIDGFLKHNEHHKEKGTGFLWKPKSADDIACCIRANAGLAPTDNTILVGIDRVDQMIRNVLDDGKFGCIGVWNNYRIRKLTPRECFRLMGVSEADIDKIQAAGISNSQQYKMAGNSIVVDVLVYIFRDLWRTRKNVTGTSSPTATAWYILP